MTQFRLPLLSIALLLTAGFSQVHAGTSEIIGTGKNPCSEFIKVVDGQWSSPINAIHFNGYISWAHGLVSGFNRYQAENSLQIDMEEFKLAIVDMCRDKPESSYAEAIDMLIQQYAGTR